ncbi:glycerate kinase [Thermoproteota archaeon]
MVSCLGMPDMIIKNREKLISKGNTKGRKIALDIIDYAMKAVDAYRLTKQLICVNGDILRVGSLNYNLLEIGDIYVLGAGKAVLQIAEALEEILGDRIKKGIVIEKKLGDMKKGLERIKQFRKITVLQGGHPIPDVTALIGAKGILEIAKEAGEGDLVFFCVQGGCTCMTTLPADGLSLEDVKETTELILESGAGIKEINSVRTPITTLSEGRLAKYIHPAEIINLVVYDGVWGYPQGWYKSRFDMGWGPSVPVQVSEFNDFEVPISVLKKYGLWEKVPDSVRNCLLDADQNIMAQTVKDFERMGIKYHTFVLANPEYGVEAAEKGAKEMGLDSVILSSTLEGEAREVGNVLAAISKEIVKNGRPLKPPCIIISSGEMTVTIVGEHGEGGRNQECVLSAALKIDGCENVVISSIGTDGTDGPTDIAGGIVDGYTMKRSYEKGIDTSENLRIHNSSYVLRELEDAIFFNEPGNNVCDLMLIIVTDACSRIQ